MLHRAVVSDKALAILMDRCRATLRILKQTGASPFTQTQTETR